MSLNKILSPNILAPNSWNFCIQSDCANCTCDSCGGNGCTDCGAPHCDCKADDITCNAFNYLGDWSNCNIDLCCCEFKCDCTKICSIPNDNLCDQISNILSCDWSCCIYDCCCNCNDCYMPDCDWSDCTCDCGSPGCTDCGCNLSDCSCDCDCDCDFNCNCVCDGDCDCDCDCGNCWEYKIKI